MIFTMVENYAGKGMIDPIINVITEFPVPHCLADDLRYRRSGGCNNKSPRLGKDFNFWWEQPFQLGIYLSCQFTKRFYRVIIRGRESSPDIQEIHLVIATIPSLCEDIRREIDGLHEILEIGSLTPHMEAQSFDSKPRLIGLQNEINRLSRTRTEF